MLPSDEIRALLFDLGGVAIEIDFNRAFSIWAQQSNLSIEEISHHFAMDAPYVEHERGQIGARDYFAHLRRALRLDGSDEEIALGWNAIYVGQVDEALGYIEQASQKLPCFAFTNSNPTHQSVWTTSYPRAVAAFQRIFVSSDLGLRKPDLAAFHEVAYQIGVPSEAILFFDDSSENIIGARAAGMPAIHVTIPSDIRDALVRIGVL